jgi:hypothetical protein
MSLSAPAIAALVFRDHLAQFPLAADACRENAATGVALHCVPEAFIEALCAGLVTAVQQVRVRGVLTGIAIPPATASPVPYTLTTVPAAASQFLAAQGWTGSGAAGAVATFITSVLTHLVATSWLQLAPSKVAGTGTALVSLASNPTLQAELETLLQGTLPAAFTAAGVFGEGDVPGAPVNATLAAQLPNYAAAYSMAFAGIVASVPYVGGTGTSVLVTEPVSGSIL